MRYFLVVLTFLVVALPASPLLADTRYVTDSTRLPMRSGPTDGYRITRYLKPGTAVEVIQENAETGYIEVKTDRGLDGWMLNRHLSKAPAARQQLVTVKAELDKLSQLTGDSRAMLAAKDERIVELESSLGGLQTDNQRLQKQFDQINATASNTIKINRDNKELVETNQRLKDKVDLLESDNARLRENHENDAFLNGAFAVLIGVFITLIVPRLWPKKKSEW